MLEQHNTENEGLRKNDVKGDKNKEMAITRANLGGAENKIKVAKEDKEKL